MFQPIRVVHTADLHLGSPFRAFPDQARRLRDEQLAALARLTAHCAREKTHLLLIAGDLFDQPLPEPSLIRTVAELLGAIPGTAVFISAGNHDPAFIDSPYRTGNWPANVHVFTDALDAVDLPELPVRVHGAGFTATAAVRSLLPEAPLPVRPDRLNLLVLHGDLVSRGQSSVYNPVSLAQLEALGMDYTALGHRHDQTDLLSVGAGYAAYSGCLLGRGFDETGEKSFRQLVFTQVPAAGSIAGLVTASGESMANHSAGSIAGAVKGSAVKSGQGARLTWSCAAAALSPGGRRFLEQAVPIADTVTHEEIAERILLRLREAEPEHWQTCVWRIRLTGETDGSLTITVPLLQRLLQEQLFYAEITDGTQRPLDLAALSRESGLLGTFVRLLTERLAAAERLNQADEAARVRHALARGLEAFSGEVTLDAYP